MVHGHEYSDEYYQFSRPDAGVKNKVDSLRDAIIRRQVLRRVPGGKLLDVGCGIGMFLQTMAGDFELWGLDISEYAIERCRERLPDAHLSAGSLTEGIPFEVTYDVITAINVFEHLDEPVAGAEVIRRHLRPGGLLVTHLPTIGNRMQARLYRGSYDQDPTHIYRPSGTAFVELVQRVGFRCVWQSYAPFVSGALGRFLRVHPAHLAVFEATWPQSHDNPR